MSGRVHLFLNGLFLRVVLYSIQFSSDILVGSEDNTAVQ